MANRTFFGVQAVNRELKILSFAAKITGTGATAAVALHQGNTDEPLSVGATATANTGGTTVTITLGDGTNVDKYEALLGVFYTAKNAAAPTHVVGVTDAVASGTVTLTLNAGPAQNDEFYVTLLLKNTSVAR
tara:strand:- start:68 stop:463 length:396 start_codon:yes stop_codon:yes gene_type:complete